MENQLGKYEKHGEKQPKEKSKKQGIHLESGGNLRELKEK